MRETDLAGDAYVLRSSIPWVLVGARRSGAPDARDRVLARGGDAGVELVGFVRELEEQAYREPDGVLRLFDRSRFAAVRSEGVAPILSATDQRRSAYTFAWKGRPSADIEEQFKRALPDILVAIEEDSESQLEWAIARVVYRLHATEADMATRRRRWLLLLGEIVAIVVVALLVGIFVT